MKKIVLIAFATVFAFGTIIQSPAYAEEFATPIPTIEVLEETEETTPTVTVQAEPNEETTSETPEVVAPVVLSEEATAFVQAVTDAEANKDNILNAAQEYVNAYTSSFEAEGEEATATADALIVEKEETFFNLFDQGALLDAYDALSEEDKNNEEVINAKALLDALVLCVDTIMNIEEPTDEPVLYTTGVTVNTGSPTIINMTQIDADDTICDIIIRTDGLYIKHQNGTETHEDAALNPDGYEFTGTFNGTAGVWDNTETILITPHTNCGITVEPGVTATLILHDLTMSLDNYIGARETPGHNDSYNYTNIKNDCRHMFNVSGATVTMILDGTNELTMNNTSHAGPRGLNVCAGVTGYNCINKNGLDGSLTIKAKTDNTDTLTCSGSRNEVVLDANSYYVRNGGEGAHNGAISNQYSLYNIYGGPNTGFGKLYIESGTVIASAGQHTPGLGANCIDAIGTDGISITGGIVKAIGGSYSAGLGAGLDSLVKNITISNGAQVYATGGINASGIGTSGRGTISGLTISGGETHVWATGDNGTNRPGIGALNGTTNVNANPNVPNWATYIKYGTSATDFSFTTNTDVNGVGESLATPISANREFATFLQTKANDGVNVYYTEVYFGLPHDEFANTDKADIGANNYSTCAGSFTWADTDAAKTQLLSLAKVSGHDQDGNLLDEADILNNIRANAAALATFNNQIQAIFDANANNATGNYLLTFTYTYEDNNDHTTKTLSVSTHIQFRDACSPTQGGSAPVIAASNAIHPTGGAAFTKAQLIGLTEGTASNYLGLDADLLNDITLTQSDVDAINAAKTANQTGIFPLTYTYVTTTDGTAPITLTKTVYVTLTDTGTPFTPKDSNHPEKGQNMGPQIGANDYITKTGGAAFDTTALKKIQNVSAKDSNGANIPLAKLIPDPTQLAAINAAKVAGQVGDFPLKYTFEDVDGTIREVETTVKLRDNEGTTPTPVEKKDDRGNLIGYEISSPELGSNNHTTLTGGTGWTEDEIKDLLDVVGKDAHGVEIPRTDFTVDATQLATLNAEKLAGKCGRYPVTFTGPNPNETVTSYVTLNGCYVPPAPTPDKFLVTYLDCYGNTVKIEWVDYKGSSSAPNGNFDGASNVTADLIIRQNNCGVGTGYRVPNTGDKE